LGWRIFEVGKLLISLIDALHENKIKKIQFDLNEITKKNYVADLYQPSSGDSYRD
jgi:hypothetical protein